ncbi:MAG TPA: amidohydrolase [Pirellulales bacterium]|nr:amidohydrolase [Pirellulales bacterium]
MMTKVFDLPIVLFLVALSPALPLVARAADEPDLILHGGKIVTVDRDFSVRQAMAVKDGQILAVGSDAELLKTRGEKTQVIDLAGKMVLPGLADSHVHPAGAAMIEFDHPIPDMESIADVLDYVKSRAAVLEEGRWIVVRQVFITRLREQRYPTKAELDAAAPRHPVVFSTGPDASVNSLALEKSGIDRIFQPAGTGKVEKDPVTGEPTGILRSAMQYLKVVPPERKPTPDEQDERLLTLLRDYTSVGITSIVDRNAGPDEVAQYRRLHAAGKLPLRVRLSHHVDASGKTSDIVAAIERIAADPLCRGDDRLRIIGLKTFLDGGMLTGSAYMSRPWGVSQIYSIDDPAYRGLLYIPRETLVPMVRAAVENGLQFTAHSVGDAAVQALLDAYEEVNRSLPVAATRPCITHSNFMSREAIDQAARLGVMVDIQPAWLYLDTRTLLAQFGYDRLRYFQPLKTLFAAGVTAGGGSDHMQKIGSLRSINPYDPWLAIWVTLTRRARWHDAPLHPEEALSREQAIRFYTINNARIMFLDDRMGSLEPGKLADFIVIDRDLLTCAVDEIRDTKVLGTYCGGAVVNGAGDGRPSAAP